MTQELSPMVKQFYDLKAKHPDAVVLFRCGDFYETYGDDAKKASDTLGITLTKSSKTLDKDGKPMCMAGFPHNALDVYLPRLVRAGHRCAICDQLETLQTPTVVSVDNDVYFLEDALDLFLEGMNACDGSEKSRMAFAYSSLKNGYTKIDTYNETENFMTSLENYLAKCKLYAEASKAYYVDSKPIMSDDKFDTLQRGIRAILNKYPEFINECNPFATPQDDHVEGFKKVKREERMHSLKDIYTREEVEKWWNSVGNCPVSVEAKLDGLSLSLIYEGGKLVQASTRGTGFEGDDVTEQVKHIDNVPLQLDADPQSKFEIRGEVVMPTETWQIWNETHDSKNQFANPRNAASGSLKQKDPCKVASRGLKFHAYYGLCAGVENQTQDYYLDVIENIGFETLPHKPYVAETLDDIMFAIENINTQRGKYTMDIDGAVLKVNAIGKWKELGYVDKYPNWAVAFKYKQEVHRAKLLSVVWQVSDKGCVSPVAIYEPTKIEGCTCRRATLCNISWIHDNLGDLRIGDTLLLKKEIVPVVVGVEHREPTSMDIVMPHQWQENINDKSTITQIGGIVTTPDMVGGKATRMKGKFLMVDVEPKVVKPKKTEEPKPQKLTDTLEGKKILVSGNFGNPQIRKDIERKVIENGATLAGGVALDVDYYVLPDNLEEWKSKASGKWQKIQEYCHQSRIITRDQFLDMIK